VRQSFTDALRHGAGGAGGLGGAGDFDPVLNDARLMECLVAAAAQAEALGPGCHEAASPLLPLLVEYVSLRLLLLQPRTVEAEALLSAPLGAGALLAPVAADQDGASAAEAVERPGVRPLQLALRFCAAISAGHWHDALSLAAATAQAASTAASMAEASAAFSVRCLMHRYLPRCRVEHLRAFAEASPARVSFPLPFVVRAFGFDAPEGAPEGTNSNDTSRTDDCGVRDAGSGCAKPVDRFLRRDAPWFAACKLLLQLKQQVTCPAGGAPFAALGVALELGTDPATAVEMTPRLALQAHAALAGRRPAEQAAFAAALRCHFHKARLPAEDGVPAATAAANGEVASATRLAVALTPTREEPTTAAVTLALAAKLEAATAAMAKGGDVSCLGLGRCLQYLFAVRV
jgi:hypothetical protein